MILLAAEQLGYLGIQGQALLTDISLSLASGQLHALLGPNGAGKSTLLRLLSGELKPSQGSVQLTGKPLAQIRIAQQARLRAVLPQQDVLAFPFLVHEVIRLGRLPAQRGSQAEEAAVLQGVMDVLDVAHLAQRPYPQLSGGEQRRVQLARVLAQMTAPPGAGANQPILLLDEPLSALDLPHQHAVMQILQQRCREGWGVLCVMHDLNMACRYASHVSLLRGGLSIATGLSPEALSSSLLQQTFGSSLCFQRTAGTGPAHWRVEPAKENSITL